MSEPQRDRQPEPKPRPGQVERFERLGARQVTELADLIERAGAADGDDPFDEAALTALQRAGPDVDHPDDRFVALVARGPAGEPVGYAQLTSVGGDRTWSLALAVDPAWRDGVGPELLRAVDEVTGSRQTALWVGPGRSWSERLALGRGWRRHRTLYRMERPLPAEQPTALADIRSFRVGQDEDAWLAVNNRAFAGHPEQGAWSRADLEAHEAYGWFDPEGFLLYESGGRLQGFCWTKLHHGSAPLIGEIYVIATDPSASGRGLGGQLVLAGLDHLHHAGAQIGMLYTEGDNIPAVRLYVSLGFVVERVRHLYRSRSG